MINNMSNMNNISNNNINNPKLQKLYNNTVDIFDCFEYNKKVELFLIVTKYIVIIAEVWPMRIIQMI